MHNELYGAFHRSLPLTSDVAMDRQAKEFGNTDEQVVFTLNKLGESDSYP